MRILFKLDDLEKQLSYIQTSLVQIEICGFDKMRQYHKFSSILSIILRLCVLSPSETDLQETQQQISHTIDFNIWMSK
ncbi:unnamed protein product [Rotaria sp. Silwood1]|nr:unnamed protein product [Rotaria sp. Silwood1]